MKFEDINDNLKKMSLAEQIALEKIAFSANQHYDFIEYKKNRISSFKNSNTNGEFDGLISYIEQFEPKIAVFAGSFNPFHKGHYNILLKAEKIFDKVIIAFGQNPDKSDFKWEIPTKIKNRQILNYNGLLTDFLDSLPYEITVVRGLRNSTDFQYEQNQYRYLQELKPSIQIVNIFCDKEFEHISSSGIRTLKKFNKHQSYLLD
ncbi:MAG: adenylyltransferase/cytidyltransferase family protein [Bacteroidia bacterium]